MSKRKPKGESVEDIEKLFPPLSPEEEQRHLERRQQFDKELQDWLEYCRKSYEDPINYPPDPKFAPVLLGIHRIQQAADRAARNGITLNELPEALRTSRVFVDCYNIAVRLYEQHHEARRREAASASAAAGADLKKAEKAQREEGWRERAREMRRADPTLSKDEICYRIFDTDPDVAARKVGLNAIYRAIRITDI